jgi:hypothetical protein
MTGEGDMDALAKKLLYSDAVSPPDAVWARIESQLPASGSRALPLFFTRFFLPGIVVTGVAFAGWWFWNNPISADQPVKLYTERNIVAPSSHISGNEAGEDTQIGDSADLNGINPDENAVNSQKSIPIGNSIIPGATSPYFAKAEIDNSTSPNKPSSHLATVAIINGDEKQFSGPFNAESTTSSQQGDVLLTNSKSLGNSEMNLSMMSPIFPSPYTIAPAFQDNKIDVDFGPQPLKGWYVGAYADLRSTTLRINSAGEGSRQLTDSLLSIENAASNFGVGIHFGYHLTPKWRLSSGLAFAKWCRTTKYPILFTVADAYEGTLATAGETIPLEQNIISATGYQMVSVNAPSEVLINTQQVIPPDASLKQQLEIEECYQLLQVPLMIEYYQSAGRFGLLPGAGLQYDYLLKRSTQLAGSGSQEQEGSAMHVEPARRSI